MPEVPWQILKFAGILAAAVAMIFVVAWRRRSHHAFLQQYGQEEVCEHLAGAFDLLKSRGHQVVRAGQKARDLPLEIHLAPAFDPKSLAQELKLADPVFVSDRNVLYCKEDWCELHPKDG